MKALSSCCTRALVVVVSFLSLSTTLLAQKETFTGYYVGIGGDTVQGTFPDYRQWEKNPVKVKFLPHSSAEPVVLAPGGCRMFHINGYESYQAYSGTRMVNPVMVNSLDINDIFDDPKDSLEEINTFLRVIYSNGPYQLLALTDKKRTNFYLQQKGKPVEELKIKAYKTNNLNYETAATYRLQLAAVFNNGAAVADPNKLLENLNYTEKELTGFLETVRGRNMLEKKENDGTGKSGFIVTGGLSVNSFRVTGDKNMIREAGAGFNTTLSPLFGVGYIVRSNRNFGKLFLLPQLKFYRYKNVGEMKAADIYSYSSKYTYQSDLAVNLTTQVGYDILRTHHITWYIAPGGGLLYLAGNKKTEEYSSNPRTVYEYKGRTLSLNLNVQTGISLKNNLMIWISYMLPSTTMDFIYYGCNHKAMQAGISYRFKNNERDHQK